jgi:hypothetical protein
MGCGKGGRRRVGRKGGEERIVQGRWMSVGVS